MDFLQKYFNFVLELLLLRNARKRTKQNGKKTKVGWWVGLGFSKCTGESVERNKTPVGAFVIYF
jgi:hypothetical protein